MILLAGLPAATAIAAAGAITNRRRPWRGFTIAFGQSDQNVYTDEAIRLLLYHACGFGSERAEENGVPEPSRLVLAYVPLPGYERLLEAFGHSVMPVPLRDRGWHWPKGRHWRELIEEIDARTAAALVEVDAEPARGLRLRLEGRAVDEVMLLPGRNFRLGASDRLCDRFRAWAIGDLEEAGVTAEVKVRKFAFEQLAAFYKRVGEKGKRFAVDTRSLVFARSEHGQHGAVPEPVSQISPVAALRRSLEGRFRFGTPLPRGFQHDVQREWGQLLDKITFDCTATGAQSVSGTHANVRPNDRVT